MSGKRSRALSRLEDHNTSPDRTQNEQIANESQRKSKKTKKSAEKSNRPPMDENVSISHHSKRSREKSPSKKIKISQQIFKEKTLTFAVS